MKRVLILLTVSIAIAIFTAMSQGGVEGELNQVEPRLWLPLVRKSPEGYWPVSLNTDGCQWGTAYAINDFGESVGQCGDSTSRQMDINNHGVVVGFVPGSGGKSNAARWEDGVLTNIGLLVPAQFPDTIHSWAEGIKDKGDIVGFWAPPPPDGHGENHAALWLGGKDFVDLNSCLPENSSMSELTEAWAINDNRWIVGFGIERATGKYGGFLLTYSTPKCGIFHLGRFGYNLPVFPTDVNELGQVVGYGAWPGGNSMPFIWEGDGLVSLIDPTSESRGTAWSINDLGQIVGFINPKPFDPSLPNTLPAIWDDNTMAILRTLPPTNPLAKPWGEARDINNQGQIVGASGQNADTDATL